MHNSFDNYYNLRLSRKEREELVDTHNRDSQVSLKKYNLVNTERSFVWIIGLAAGAVDAFFLTNFKYLKTDKVTSMLKDKQLHLKDTGWVNNEVDKRIKNLFTQEQISNFEKKFKVPYDASTNRFLEKDVVGLGIRTHRYSSPGHDPVLGFYYGVKDILNGEFTAINNIGAIETQKINNFDNTGMTLFKAIALQIGHLLSDVSTSAGLPVPFMSQLSRLTKKRNGEYRRIDDFTIDRLCKNMYTKGYNFNHLLSMSVVGLLIEVGIRLSYFIYSISQGNSLKDSIPFNKPKLDKMLLYSYAIASGCNGVKIAVTGGNIFAANPVIWAGTLRYGFSCILTYVKNEKENERHQYIIDLYNKRIKAYDIQIEEEIKFYSAQSTIS